MIVASVIESMTSSDFVINSIYHSVWFIALWGVMAVATVAAVRRWRMWRNGSLMVLHLAFVVILAGAATTLLFGQRGYIHLREGEQTDHFISSSGGQELQLPFTLKLERFWTEHYTGTNSVSDYISYVSYKDGVRGEISMNKILKIDNYRLYQTSYDHDERGTYLTVSYDPWGIGITYCGYILLAIAMLWYLGSSRGEFMRLMRHPLLRKGAAVVLAIIYIGGTQAQTRPTLAREQADSIATIAIRYNGRIAPFNTMAHELLVKIYGRDEYNDLTAEQVVGSWILYPEEWQYEPIIKVESRALRQALNIEGRYTSLYNLYAEGDRLEQLRAEHKEGETLSKELMQLEERVSLMAMVRNGSLHEPYYGYVDEHKIKAEVLYNRYNIVSSLYKIHLGLGILAFAAFVYSQLRRKRIAHIKSLLAVQVIHSFCFVTFILALRWYITGHIPLSNGYETLLSIAWAIMAVSLLFYRRFDIVPAAALLLSGVVLMVCNLSAINPQITALMPALSSGWLSMHVSIIMVAYTLYTFIFFGGCTALTLHAFGANSEEIEKLKIISQILLYPATFMLAAGIFIGAVWANVSWGRYWGWDPKEVWAMITMMIYAIALHKSLFKRLDSPITFHIFTVVAFLSVVMTYFGVNYLLGGLHSYVN